MYESKMKSEAADELFQAILSLETVEECYRFFDDICTIKEINDLRQRFQVAKFLSEGKTFNEIVSLTGASTATITRVNRCLHYGAEGYSRALERVKGTEASDNPEN